MKKKLSKRAKLYIANGIFFVLAIVFCFFDIMHNAENKFTIIFVSIFKFIVIQSAFTLMTLIVYYLSIMADALDRGYKKEEDKENKEDKK